VAEIDLTTGDYVRGLYVRPEGVVDAGPTPVCPAECAADAPPSSTPQVGPDGGSDAMAGADGGVADAGPDAAFLPAPARRARPSALALSDDGRVLLIGGASSRLITRVDIDPDSAFGAIRQLELDACPAPATPPATPELRCDPMGVVRL